MNEIWNIIGIIFSVIAGIPVLICGYKYFIKKLTKYKILLQSRFERRKDIKRNFDSMLSNVYSNVLKITENNIGKSSIRIKNLPEIHKTIYIDGFYTNKELKKFKNRVPEPLLFSCFNTRSLYKILYYKEYIFDITRQKILLNRLIL